MRRYPPAPYEWINPWDEIEYLVEEVQYQWDRRLDDRRDQVDRHAAETHHLRQQIDHLMKLLSDTAALQTQITFLKKGPL